MEPGRLLSSVRRGALSNRLSPLCSSAVRAADRSALLRMLLSLNTFWNVILVSRPSSLPSAPPPIPVWSSDGLPAMLDAHRKPKSRNAASEIVINRASINTC